MTATPAENVTAVKQRDQSTISFPYGDLEDGEAVAQAILKMGGVPCEVDQLAAALNQSISGNFRMKVATAKVFGLIETVQNKYQLTDLGFEILDKQRNRAARVEAFLRVPLYKKLYEDFRNRTLPPRPAALEKTLVSFGVAPKQKERARQAFDRSAQQAGFFDQGGKDRLIRPVTAGIAAELPPASAGEAEDFVDETPPPPTFGGGNGGGGNRTGQRHPFIQGLLDTLPQPETNWTIEGRAKWLEAAAKIFDLIYKGSGEITVKVKDAKTATDESAAA